MKCPKWLEADKPWRVVVIWLVGFSPIIVRDILKMLGW